MDQITVILLISACVISTICSTISIIISISALISMKSLEKSTHNVQYVPLDETWSSSDKEIDELNERSELGLTDIDEEGASNVDISNFI